MGDVPLCCWRCSLLNSGPNAVAIWQLDPDHLAVGYCRDCLNTLLGMVDEGELPEPERLEFLVDPAALMARAA